MLLPLRNNVLVAALDDPDSWYGSSLIVRPESTKDRSDQGIVKAVGPGVKEVQVGDYVTFSPYSGMVVNDADEGNKLIMLSEDGVIAIITPPTTKVENVFIRIDYGHGVEHEPATAEALILLLRESYHKMPRVVEQKRKWEQRLAEMG
jgi:co-chaperonin GroES (HSP10)